MMNTRNAKEHLYRATLTQGDVSAERDLTFREWKVLQDQGPRAAALLVLKRHRLKTEVLKWAASIGGVAFSLWQIGQIANHTRESWSLICPLCILGGQWFIAKTQVDRMQLLMNIADDLEDEPHLPLLESEPPMTNPFVNLP